MNRIKQERQKIWPHLAMRGATGSERQIGHDADWDSGDAITCKMLVHSRYKSASAACVLYTPSGETTKR